MTVVDMSSMRQTLTAVNIDVDRYCCYIRVLPTTKRKPTSIAVCCPSVLDAPIKSATRNNSRRRLPP